MKNNKENDLKQELIDKIAQNPMEEDNYIELGRLYLVEQNLYDYANPSILYFL